MGASSLFLGSSPKNNKKHNENVQHKTNIPTDNNLAGKIGCGVNGNSSFGGVTVDVTCGGSATSSNMLLPQSQYSTFSLKVFLQYLQTNITVFIITYYFLIFTFIISRRNDLCSCGFIPAITNVDANIAAINTIIAIIKKVFLFIIV